jgi:hypothetical protein
VQIDTVSPRKPVPPAPRPAPSGCKGTRIWYRDACRSPEDAAALDDQCKGRRIFYRGECRDPEDVLRLQRAP